MSKEIDITNEIIKKIESGQIDTVLVCLVDMQGRLMGKRFHVRNFVKYAMHETHCCNYLLATDLEMSTPAGYRSSSWEKGYGDYIMRPDLTTFRLMPWLEGTAMVLCDIVDHHTHTPVSHSPRQVLKRQVERLTALGGYEAMMATELEFFLFEGTVDQNRKNDFRNITPVGGFNQDYHIFQTTKEEPVMRRLRNTLYAAGIEVECTKGEAEMGQEELNLRYGPAMVCAEQHTIAKHATKEIAWQQGFSATFLPKWRADKVGSSSHIHCSLFKDNTNVFYDQNRPFCMSELMDHFVAGLLSYAQEYTYFLAPNINSYKRFRKGTFAPTKVGWSVDNRTAGFRLCGAESKGVRIECRIPGADVNPYLAQAALLAAGIKGIEERKSLPPPNTGDLYSQAHINEIPRTLRAATETLRRSDMLRHAMGDDVIDHYVRAAEVEQEEFDAVVTDWEISRGFERC
ncbi:glutamine synthetase family protein [Acidocella sp.]|uniref:glutamine synthetase family protein n=1 Tax=Acidocella sp. TaxID=50710 RepID=UPI002632BD44|nr:glutamine synthetase family protein [Acidocella sp.]